MGFFTRKNKNIEVHQAFDAVADKKEKERHEEIRMLQVVNSCNTIICAFGSCSISDVLTRSGVGYKCNYNSPPDGFIGIYNNGKLLIQVSTSTYHYRVYESALLLGHADLYNGTHLVYEVSVAVDGYWVEVLRYFMEPDNARKDTLYTEMLMKFGAVKYIAGEWENYLIETLYSQAQLKLQEMDNIDKEEIDRLRLLKEKVGQVKF